MFDVSICIATFRRPERLARLLDALARQKTSHGPTAEIVVVDNDPSGSARPVIESVGVCQPIRYVVEPEPNVSVARNRSVEVSSGSWIAFVDDDEVPREDWLAAYWRCVEHGDADGWFGPVYPVLETCVTPWLDPDTFYANPRHATGDAVPASDVCTSNALVHRRLFEGRAFDPAFGAGGGHVEDTELFGRMLREGARFRWCDGAAVDEAIPAERHRLRWLARRHFFGGFAHTHLERAAAPTHYRPWQTGLRAGAALGALSLALPFAMLAGRRSGARVALRACVQAGHLWAVRGGAFHAQVHD